MKRLFIEFLAAKCPKLVNDSNFNDIRPKAETVEQHSDQLLR